MPGIDDARVHRVRFTGSRPSAGFAGREAATQAAHRQRSGRSAPGAAGDSRAYHQPIAAAPATATKNSVRMSVACHWRTLAGGCFDIQNTAGGRERRLLCDRSAGRCASIRSGPPGPGRGRLYLIAGRTAASDARPAGSIRTHPNYPNALNNPNDPSDL